jgi:DeoR/GlpR family transcriptional regulator of sugar metabolism
MSYSELASIMKVSDKTIRRYVNNLADIGDITVERGDGRGNRTVFGFPEMSDE